MFFVHFYPLSIRYSQPLFDFFLVLPCSREQRYKKYFSEMCFNLVALPPANITHCISYYSRISLNECLIASLELYFAFHKDTSEALIQKLQDALDELKNKGEYQKILDKYLGPWQE